MKKTITRPDGTQEVVEGTPEELAEMERLQREGVPAPTNESAGTKRRLLTDVTWRHPCVV